MNTNQNATSTTRCRHSKKEPRIYVTAKKCTCCQNHLIEQHMGLVYVVQKSLPHVEFPDEDLAQYGYIGMIKAIQNFKHELGYKFTTFAGRCIYHEYLASFPKTKPAEFYTDDLRMFERPGDPLSRSYDTTNLEQEDDVRSIIRALGQLDKYQPRDADVFRRILGIDGYTEPQRLREVGKAHGISKERARQLYVRAVRFVRNAVSSTQQPVEDFPVSVQSPRRGRPPGRRARPQVSQ